MINLLKIRGADLEAKNRKGLTPSSRSRKLKKTTFPSGSTPHQVALALGNTRTAAVLAVCVR